MRRINLSIDVQKLIFHIKEIHLGNVTQVDLTKIKTQTRCLLVFQHGARKLQKQDVRQRGRKRSEAYENVMCTVNVLDQVLVFFKWDEIRIINKSVVK